MTSGHPGIYTTLTDTTQTEAEINAIVYARFALTDKKIALPKAAQISASSCTSEREPPYPRKTDALNFDTLLGLIGVRPMMMPVHDQSAAHISG